MRRFKNILVFTDGDARSEVALDRGAALAERNGAQLTAVSVLESLPRELQRLSAAAHPADLWDLALRERKERLDRVVAGSWNENQSFATKVLCGSPITEVIKEVLQQGHDLVVMAAEGEGGVKEVLFGNVSTQLMRRCPCPVWVMKSGQRARYERVMAAVDPITADGGHESLNHKIMQMASSLARIEEARLHVLHAWSAVTEPISVFGRLPLSEPKLVADARQAHQIALCKLLQESDVEGLGMDVHLVRGEAGNLIPRLAQAMEVDVIVMGTVCRTGVRGMLIGNTAEKVLRKVGCSVLVVKPDGFISPVTSELCGANDCDPALGQKAMTLSIKAGGNHRLERF